MDAAPAEVSDATGATPAAVRRPWLPYVLPFALFLAFLCVESQWPDERRWLYPVKTLVVGVVLVIFRRFYDELRPTLSLPAIMVGTLAIVIWIALDPFYPGLSRLTGGTPPAAFEPFSLRSTAASWTYILARVAGAVLMVPVMEELFWRGFLARWLVNHDFRAVPLGTFTPFSFWATVVLFGVEHEQWLAGMICGALLNGLLYRTKSLFACVLAHATSNALLAAWVLARADWKFW